MAESVDGWLTRDQAMLLWDSASELRSGATILEIGSHQGRSTIVLAAAARARGCLVIAVDPFVEGRLFGGASTKQKFLNNISAAEVSDVVELREAYSTALRPEWKERVDLLYIDGKHDYWTASDDLRWAEFLPTGGKVLVHDCYSSIGVTLAVLVKVLPARTLRFSHRAGSLACFERVTPTSRDRLRIAAQLPWWFRNVFIKVLLRLRMRFLARALGHDSPFDPY
jgi:hypothetical protein